MPACLLNMNGPGSITFYLKSLVGFQSLSKDDYRVEKHELIFRIIGFNCKSYHFIIFLAKI